jgi:hypothetical protein
MRSVGGVIPSSFGVAADAVGRIVKDRRPQNKDFTRPGWYCAMPIAAKSDSFSTPSGSIIMKRPAGSVRPNDL